jgi:hypothetical protein
MKVEPTYKLLSLQEKCKQKASKCGLTGSAISVKIF